MQSIAPLFTPNPLAGQPHPKIIRSAAEQRYDEALDFLRLQLKKDSFELFSPAEFSNAFRISQSFTTALLRLKAVERKWIKPAGNYYKALDKLWTITSLDVLKECRRGNLKSRQTVKLSQCQSEDMPKQTPSNLSTFLVGLTENNNVVISIDSKFDSVESEALKTVEGLNCTPGSKIILLKVVGVFEPKTVLQPASL